MCVCLSMCVCICVSVMSITQKKKWQQNLQIWHSTFVSYVDAPKQIIAKTPNLIVNICIICAILDSTYCVISTLLEVFYEDRTNSLYTEAHKKICKHNALWKKILIKLF